MTDPRNLWQTQEVEEMKFSVEELRAKAAKFQRRVQRRNLREYLAALIVIVWCGWGFWNMPQIVPRIAFAWLMAAAIFYTWYLHRWGSARPVPGDMGDARCISFYRRELQRQRDLVHSVWKWALGPTLPGLVLLAFYNFTSAPPAKRGPQVGYMLGEAVFFAAVLWLNMRAARRLDRRIAELDREADGI
jgi:hypothetical protein